VVLCIGALPHASLCLLPVSAIVDALFSRYHRSVADLSRPPVDFAPVFVPEDQAPFTSGFKPALFPEADVDVGFREMQRCLVVRAPNGENKKALSYRHPSDRLSKVFMAQGVLHWADKTHLAFRAESQMGEQWGAVESDIKEHALW